jgi:site-specific DNA-methyltransferase (adenine-specific)
MGCKVVFAPFAGKHGPVPALSDATDIRLIHADCVEGMREMEEASVDVIVTSPPYNLGIQYDTYDDRKPREEYLTWSGQWAAEVKRVLKEDGSFFLNIGAAPADPFLPHELALEFRDLFQLQNTFHWIKSITVEPKAGPQVSAGHFKPINSKRFVTDCHEYVFHWTKSGKVQLDRLAIGVPYQDKSNIARWGHTEGKDKRCRGNNWFIPYKTIQSRSGERPHPATFPVQLASWCVRLHGAGADTVMMDPFNGIGHSALAALECGVSEYTGFDIDEGYLKEAKRRVEEQKQLLL